MTYPFTGDDVDALYEGGSGDMSWTDVRNYLNDKYGLSLNSAIPIRALWYETMVGSVEAIPKAIVAARDEDGMGWDQIAGRAGIPVSRVKALYVEGGGLYLDGRPYGKGASVRHVSRLQLQAARRS